MDGIVVVGASQGGVHALRHLIKALPSNFPAPVVVVLHVGGGQSILPSILNDLGGLRATHIRQDEELEPGHVYVAPSDRHVLVVDSHLTLSHGPRENWARPAVDPLFRTAAQAFGDRVIGVVLTGQLNDGTAGLYEIKQRGGVAIVQDPAEAEAPSMPRSAIENVGADYVLPVAEIGALLVKLVGEAPKRAEGAQPG